VPCCLYVLPRMIPVRIARTNQCTRSPTQHPTIRFLEPSTALHRHFPQQVEQPGHFFPVAYLVLQHTCDLRARP